ncbi:MAG: glutathione S-transferase N-terminal domain-containing protein [Rhodospirillales bacterium]
MIDLYTWPTPNGHKVHIMLEETGLEYKVIPININKGDQFDADYLKISPNNKMPAMVDPDGPDGGSYSLFESGAILMYLAEKTGKFMPQETQNRYLVIQWLMFQMGGIGPMFGQAHHFRQYAPDGMDLSYAVDRYTNEAGRLYGVLDRRLGESEYLAGEYSIADIAAFPWTRSYERQGQRIDDFPNFKRWFNAINERPAVERALKILADKRKPGWEKDSEARKNLFGAAQYQRR